MEKRQLGNNGPMVSAIGLGCWSFGGAYGPTDEAESHSTLARALDLGIDLLDTANVYGNGVSETVIGSFIKDHPGRFKIATKAGIWRNPEGKRDFNNEPAYLRGELEKSLKRLGVEHVELYYIHRREQARPIEEVMETLVSFKDEGKIGAIGFSEIAPHSLKRAAAVHPVAAVQSEYSLWTRLPELGMVQTCKELGTAFLPFSPLGRGIFSDRLIERSQFEKGDFRMSGPRFLEPNLSANLKMIEGFKALARDKGVSTAGLALAWILHQADHMIPLPGTRSAKNLEECVQGASISLSERDLATIDTLLPIGFAHGDRYSDAQIAGAERYC
ncbi:MAG: aldo/keto reductase [Pseudomonadota bacterium]